MVTLSGFALLLTIVGGLVGLHVGGGYAAGGRAWTKAVYGAGIGLAAGILLPPVLGLVAALLHLAFLAALICAAVLVIIALLRAIG